MEGMNKDLKEAARLLGSIRSEKKANAVRRNLEKARAMKAEIKAFKENLNGSSSEAV